MVCLRCPIGCRLTVVSISGAVLSVTGNQCPRGREYAEEETASPRRILTTTVRVLGSDRELVSVKTAAPIPRDKIPAVMDLLRTLKIKAPIAAGEVLVEDAAQTGIAVVTTQAAPGSPPS